MPIFDVTLFFLDAFNRKSNRSYTVDVVDFSAAQAAADSLVTIIQDLIRCGIIKTRVGQDVDVATVVGPGANIDAGLTFSWELAPLGSEKLAASKLPGPIDGIFDSNGNLDLTNANVVAYEAAFANAVYRISDGEMPVDLKSGKLDR